MATIKIHRGNGDMGFMRCYKIFIDGQKVGKIGSGQTREFAVSAGQHTVRAGIDWCGSPTINVDANDSNPNILIVGGSKKFLKWILFCILGGMGLGFIWIFATDMPAYASLVSIIPMELLFIYQLTIARKKQLTLCEIDNNT
jgi:hypothetical protein